MAKIEARNVSNGDAALLGPTFVELRLAEYSDNDGVVILSPLLATDPEIDYHIDNLIKQLQTARVVAKRSLAARRGQ
jgi:hypothetical protein